MSGLPADPATDVPEGVLRVSELRYRRLFESAKDGILILDASTGQITDVNPFMVDLLGYTREEYLGKVLWEIGAFKDVAASKSAFSELQHLQYIRYEDLPLTTKDGRQADVEFVSNVYPEGDHDVIQCNIRDISKRKAAARKLVQAQKMEAVGMLAGGMAHDFNNLLGVIIGNLELLQTRTGLDRDEAQLSLDALDAAIRGADLIRGLLAFARRQPLKPQIFSVSNQIESIAQLIRPVVGSGIQITLDVGGPDAGFFALADVAQFETAIINLAVNARDAMPEGGELLIKVGRVDGVPPLRGQPRRAGAFITVSMTDTGTGIPSDKLEMIFEPFFTTKEVGKGTGLGLSQAFGFAKQSGGDITVTSAPAAGATFTLYLPQAEMPQDAAGVEAAAADAVQSGRGHRVLVVEDNEDIGRFSTDLLQDLGYKISWVTNATDALTALSRDEFAFDLVFSDIIMPGMNGVELATAIRERFPGLPVVLTSGYSNVLAENAHSGFELIQKPYSVEALSRTLRRAIGERRPAAG